MKAKPLDARTLRWCSLLLRTRYRFNVKHDSAYAQGRAAEDELIADDLLSAARDIERKAKVSKEKSK